MRFINTFLRFCIAILPFYTRFLPFPTPKHRLCNRNFSLLLCKITLKMHKNKFFCIRHFTLFEQICYKSCKISNFICAFCKLYCIFTHTFARLCHIMHIFYIRPASPALTSVFSYTRARACTRTIHTHAYTHAFNIYKGVLVELSCENI